MIITREECEQCFKGMNHQTRAACVKENAIKISEDIDYKPMAKSRRPRKPRKDKGVKRGPRTKV